MELGEEVEGSGRDGVVDKWSLEGKRGNVKVESDEKVKGLS